jgi:multiple sugar transport system substrate-binding protein
MTRSRSRIRALVLASALAVVAGACGSSATPATTTPSAAATAATAAPAASGAAGGLVPLSSGPVHLVMWEQWGGSGPNAEAMKSMIDAYQKSHPGVIIEDVAIAGTDNAKILTAMSGGKPPFDILDMGLGLYLGSWASKGALMPLEDFIKRSNLDTGLYVDSMLKAMQVNGKQYALPFMGFNTGLIYNKQLFQAAGLDPNKPPTTTEELATYAEKLTKVGPNGEILQLGFLPEYPGAANGQVCTLEVTAWSFGGGWFDEATQKPTANNPKNVEALTWEKSFYDKYGAQNIANFMKSSGAYLTAQDLIEGGKLAMVFDGPWNLTFAAMQAPDMAKYLGAAPFPSPADRAQFTGSSFIDANPQAIPVGAAHADAAFDFIAWETTNVDVTNNFAATVNNLPQLKSSPGFKLASDPNFKVFIDEAGSENAHVWPQLPYSTEYQVKMCEAQQSALYGEKTPQQALDDLQSLALAMH